MEKKKTIGEALVANICQWIDASLDAEKERYHNARIRIILDQLDVAVLSDTLTKKELITCSEKYFGKNELPRRVFTLLQDHSFFLQRFFKNDRLRRLKNMQKSVAEARSYEDMLEGGMEGSAY